MERNPAYRSYFPDFDDLIDHNEDLVPLYTGTGYSEGPAYFGGGRYLVWSDIPRDRMFRLDETDGSVSIFRQPSQHANGNTVDLLGRLITCEHASRRVTRTEHDGSITIIADRWQGKALNSPNDVVVKSDGSIWFTDPPYGIDNNYGAPTAESDIGAHYVFRVDPSSGKIDAVITDMIMPNGLAFSPDEKKIYVVDSGRTHSPSDPAHIRVFDVSGDGRVTGGSVFAECDAFIFDGMRLDERGNIWVGAGDGVQCFNPHGERIGCIATPEVCGNVEFGGGPSLNRLYICCITTLFSINLKVSGLKRRYLPQAA
ncbi:gluconolactonase [Rhizobium sp. Root708]|uniref:SMP-30/gluconolactonase/LRE family protein n=1 Tax=Rhizobium sp. Root708 TaxID=1736592 RepID=UPI0006F39B81|nr:SMP-30/gluconolactonase/LRE family protein [Rhizobium sp. Root708]KRB49101.1 gluconolactonase [Rhizobium sp. Root708]